MTAPGGGGLPRYARVAASLREQIANGTLRPGQSAPSGAALSRISGYSTLTCRKALRVLIADGILVPGPSRNARPRVAGARTVPAERDLADATRALSAGLAARRRAAGLTQAEFAGLADASVTTVGHAETGRVWQSRRFWERADAVLHAGGELLRLHDVYRALGAVRQQGARSQPDSEERAGPAVPTAMTPAGMIGRATVPEQPMPGPAAPGPAAPGQLCPSSIMIVWSDGSITTVHPPSASRR